MALLGYAGDSFWRGIEWLGRDSLARGIAARKLQLVYIHWSVLLVFLVVSILAVGVLIRRAAEFRRVVSPWVAICMLIYCLVVGLFFFNRMGFTHAMLGWPWHMFVVSMLGSLAFAVVPVWFLYIMGAGAREAGRVRVRVYLVLLPVLHSLMAVIYLASPYVAVE